MVDETGNQATGLQYAQQLQQQELGGNDARQCMPHDMEAGRHPEDDLHSMPRQHPVPGLHAAEAVRPAEEEIGGTLRQSSNGSRLGTAARANGSNEGRATQDQGATGGASHPAHHGHAAGHGGNAPRAQGNAMPMEPPAQQSSTALQPDATVTGAAGGPVGAAQQEQQQHSWRALLAGQVSGGSASEASSTKAAQQRELWHRLQLLHQAARVKAGLIPAAPQGAQRDQAVAGQGTAFPALAQSAAMQRLAAHSQAACGHPGAAAGQLQQPDVAAGPCNPSGVGGSRPTHGPHQVRSAGLQSGGGTSNGWVSPRGGLPERPSSPIQATGNGSAAGPHRAPDGARSGAGLAGASGSLGPKGQGSSQAAPGAPAACESERGGVPGEGTPEGAAFLASLQRHWHAEAAPDYVQGRWAVPLVGIRQLDLAALYRQVGLHGGYQRVDNHRWWDNIGMLMGYAPTPKLKAVYEKFLRSYANRFYDPARFAGSSAQLYQNNKVNSVQGSERGRERQGQVWLQQERATQPHPANGGQPHGASPVPLASAPANASQAWSRASGMTVQQAQRPHAAGASLPQPHQLATSQMLAGNRLVHVAPAHLQSLQRLMADRQRHAAQQHAAVELQRQAAIARIGPSPGPVLQVAQTFTPQQLHEVVMCLRSGLASCVPWALNILALASFQTRPELLLPGLPGLLPALLQVLERGVLEDPTKQAAEDWAVNTAALEAKELPGPRPPRKRQKHGDSPGEPRGWWWEARGLLSDGGAADARFTWAVCAGSVLRSLAFTRANQALMADPACIGLLAACLEARNSEPSAGFNELALSLLDTLRALGPAAAQATPPQAHARLLRALCGVLRHAGNAPLRVRAAAAATLGTLAACAAFSPAVVDALCGEGGQVVQGLLDLLLLGLEEAKDAVMGEARGDCGPPEVPVQDITPEALHHAGVATQADAMSAAAQALARLAAVQPGSAPKEVLAAQPYAVPALVAVLLGRHPQPPAGIPLPSELASHASYLLRRAMESAAFALWHIAGCAAGRLALQAHVCELAACALSEHVQSNNIIVLLGRLP